MNGLLYLEYLEIKKNGTFISYHWYYFVLAFILNFGLPIYLYLLF